MFGIVLHFELYSAYMMWFRTSITHLVLPFAGLVWFSMIQPGFALSGLDWPGLVWFGYLN